MQQLNNTILPLSIKHRFFFSGLLFAYLPHIHTQAVIVSLFYACFIFCCLAHLYFDIALPHKWLATTATIVTIVIVALAEPVFLGLNMGVAILIIALCLKLLEINNSDEFLVTIGLGYFVAIMALLFSHSVLVSLSVVIAICLLTFSLSLHNSRRQSTHRVFIHTFRLALQATPLTIVLLLLVPQTIEPLWQLPMDARNGSLGLSDHMAPGKILRLMENDDVAFRVKFDTPPKNASQLYWRGPVFTHYNGQSWLPGHSPRYDSESLPPARLPTVESSPANLDNTAKYTITLEPHNYRWLLTLDHPEQTIAGRFLSIDGEYLADQKIYKPLSYTVISSLRPADSEKSIYNSQPYLLQRYLRLPNLYAYKTRQLANKFKQQAGDGDRADRRIVDLALNYFSNKPFYYSKNPPPIKYDPVEEFLFKTRKGYCEHYASAFTFLMRAAGIPSRVVTGFYGGEYNTAGDYYIIRQSNAHAWSEVWLRDSGWTRIDPTTVIPEHRVEIDTDKQLGSITHNGSQFSIYADVINYRWNHLIIMFDNVIHRSATEWLLILKSIDLTVILISFIFILSFVVSLFITYLAKKRSLRDPVIHIYTQFCKKFAAVGIVRQPHESANAFMARIVQARPELAATGDKVSLLYNQLRYSRNPSANAIGEFRKIVRAIKI